MTIRTRLTAWYAGIMFISLLTMGLLMYHEFAPEPHPQGAPAYIANLWTTYAFSIAGMPGFHVGAGVNYVSRSYSDITNVNSIPSYVIANAAFGYEARRWGVDLNVHNITDRLYFIAANAAGAYVGESLSAFVNLHANF